MSSEDTILLTGYEAFGDFKVNPSIAACMELDGRDIDGYRVAVEEITMKFDGVKEAIEGHLERYKPAAVVCTGVSGAGAVIAVERVAINVFSARGGVMGKEAQDAAIREDGPVGYFTTLPYRRILEALKEASIPARLSNSAGTVGCNLIFYYLMDYLARNRCDIPAGFIHVPRLPEQALNGRSPSMSLEVSASALEVAIKELVSELKSD
jgi:pyroglutamyl-peptidase